MKLLWERTCVKSKEVLLLAGRTIEEKHSLVMCGFRGWWCVCILPPSIQTDKHSPKHRWRYREGGGGLLMWSGRPTEAVSGGGGPLVYLFWLNHMFLRSWHKVVGGACSSLPVSLVSSVPAAPHEVSPGSCFSLLVRQLSALWLQSGSRQLSGRGWCHHIPHPQYHRYDDGPTGEKYSHIL